MAVEVEGGKMKQEGERRDSIKGSQELRLPGLTWSLEDTQSYTLHSDSVGRG